MAEVDLLDISVWIALSSSTHPHHARAAAYWHAEARQRLAFNTHTMLGLVRIVTNARLVGGSALTVESAWRLYRSWRADESVEFISEPQDCHNRFQEYVESGVVHPRTWSDAYLAAFASSAGVRLVSFDSDFARFPVLDWLHLKT